MLSLRRVRAGETHLYGAEDLGFSCLLIKHFKQIGAFRETPLSVPNTRTQIPCFLKRGVEDVRDTEFEPHLILCERIWRVRKTEEMQNGLQNKGGYAIHRTAFVAVVTADRSCLRVLCDGPSGLCHQAGAPCCVDCWGVYRPPCLAWCRKSQRTGSWLRAVAWADLRDLLVILSTLREGYNELMSSWRAVACSYHKEFIFRGRGPALDLCFAVGWILSTMSMAFWIASLWKKSDN